VITGGLTGEEIVEPLGKLFAETDSKLKRPIKYGATKRTKRFEIASGFIKSLVQILAKLVNKFFIHCKTFDFNNINQQKKAPHFQESFSLALIRTSCKPEVYKQHNILKSLLNK
jgi:hypothetical protein